MIRIFTVAVCCLVSLGAADLDVLFARAESDPQAIVPLLESVNRAIGQADGDDAIALADRAAPFARQLYFGTRSLPGEERLGIRVHKVQAGEYPVTIARKYGIQADLIARMNEGFDANALRIGQRLRVVDLAQDAAATVLVDRSTYRALLVRIPDGGGPQLMACLPVGLGTSDRQTPVGASHVVKRVRNPEWRHPDTKEILPPDHPDNVLGGYWLGLDAGPDERFQSIGFHGYTGAPSDDWLEKAGSRGCIRMLQPDIDLLFDVARHGLRVVVTD